MGIALILAFGIETAMPKMGTLSLASDSPSLEEPLQAQEFSFALGRKIQLVLAAPGECVSVMSDCLPQVAINLPSTTTPVMLFRKTFGFPQMSTS